MNSKIFDDGNWGWNYICSPNNHDWCYEIYFETEKGGFLNSEEIGCFYWKPLNLLQIQRKGTSINFYVENFKDIEIILNPMIKANKAIVYPLYKSNILAIKKERKDKLNKINKITSEIELKKIRYEKYLKLKKEFENEN